MIHSLSLAITSFVLRTIGPRLRAVSRGKRFLASCCVMVEPPPCEVFCSSTVFTATRASEGMSMPEWLRKRTSSVAMSAATIGGTSRPSSRMRSVESDEKRSSYCT